MCNCYGLPRASSCGLPRLRRRLRSARVLDQWLPGERGLANTAKSHLITLLAIAIGIVNSISIPSLRHHSGRDGEHHCTRPYECVARFHAHNNTVIDCANGWSFEQGLQDQSEPGPTWIRHNEHYNVYGVTYWLQWSFSGTHVVIHQFEFNHYKINDCC